MGDLNAALEERRARVKEVKTACRQLQAQAATGNGAGAVAVGSEASPQVRTCAAVYVVPAGGCLMAWPG